MANYHLYDRWISMNITNRKQLFEVNLSDCIDEFGNSFGKKGSHFFIKVLSYKSDMKKAKSYLKKYYKENVIQSVDQVIETKIKSEIGKMYFCPWEENRVRGLSKFKNSHKIGPTPDKVIDEIIIRLFNLFFQIQQEGFTQFFRLNGYPRCYELKLNNKKSFYVPRDGQHRLAVLSYLGYEKVKVCYEFNFWEQSRFLTFIRFLKRGTINKSSRNHLKIVDPNMAINWPHVIQKKISKADAVKYFYRKFKLKNLKKE